MIPTGCCGFGVAPCVRFPRLAGDRDGRRRSVPFPADVDQLSLKIGMIGAFDFTAVEDVFEQAAPAVERFKTQLGELLEA